MTPAISHHSPPSDNAIKIYLTPIVKVWINCEWLQGHISFGQLQKSNWSAEIRAWGEACEHTPLIVCSSEAILSLFKVITSITIYQSVHQRSGIEHLLRAGCWKDSALLAHWRLTILSQRLKRYKRSTWNCMSLTCSDLKYSMLNHGCRECMILTVSESLSQISYCFICHVLECARAWHGSTLWSQPVSNAGMQGTPGHDQAGV